MWRIAKTFNPKRRRSIPNPATCTTFFAASLCIHSTHINPNNNNKLTVWVLNSYLPAYPSSLSLRPKKLREEKKIEKSVLITNFHTTRALWERVKGSHFSLFFSFPFFVVLFLNYFSKNTAHTHCGTIDLTCRLDGRLTTWQQSKSLEKASRTQKCKSTAEVLKVPSNRQFGKWG